MKNQETDKLYIELGKHYKKREIKRLAPHFEGTKLIVMLSYGIDDWKNIALMGRVLVERHPNILNKDGKPLSWKTYKTRFTELESLGILEKYFPQTDSIIPITLRLPESLHIRLKARSTEKDVSINKLINTAIKRMLRQ